MKSLTNQVVIVTGASRGLGAAIARKLASQGARVVINVNASVERAQALAEEILQAGGTAVVVQADVSTSAGAEALVEGALAAFGRIDHVVNNAGVLVGDDDFAAIERMLAVNITGVLAVSHYAAAKMEDGGSIVNLSSVVGRDPVPGMAAYSATKGAVDTITKSLSRSLAARQIRVNAVAPGYTDTEMSSAAGPEFRQFAVDHTPMGRVGEPEDIADVVAFLVSQDARWMTGEILGVGGGIRL